MTVLPVHPVHAPSGPDGEAPPRPALDPEDVLDAAVSLAREAFEAGGAAQVAELGVRRAAELVGADQGTIGLASDGEIVTVASLEMPRAPLGSRFPVGFGVAGWVAATGQPAEIGDVREDRRYVALPYPEVRSFLALPLRVGSELVGTLSLAAWRPRAFPTGTARALAPFATQLAQLLRHAAEDETARTRLEALEDEVRSAMAESLHELKAPLQAVIGFLEIVAGGQLGPLTANQTDFLETAREEAARLREGLVGLLEAGAAPHRSAAARTAVDPADLATAAVRRTRGQALSRGVELALEVDEHLPRVLVDRAAMLQVLANLLQNALRVAPRGSTITVGVTAEDGWMCFMVADRGPGLGGENQQQLFDRFRQGACRSAERAPGEVGLGLWLSRQIVERHDGLIWAEDRPGGGARFCVGLPVAWP